MTQGRGDWHKWKTRSYWRRTALKDSEWRAIALVPIEKKLAQVERVSWPARQRRWASVAGPARRGPRFRLLVAERPLDEVERLPRRVFAEAAVARDGVEHDLEILVGFLEGVHQLQRVLHVDIVVHDAVLDEDIAVQVLGGFDDGGLA